MQFSMDSWQFNIYSNKLTTWKWRTLYNKIKKWNENWNFRCSWAWLAWNSFIIVLRISLIWKRLRLFKQNSQIFEIIIKMWYCYSFDSYEKCKWYWFSKSCKWRWYCFGGTWSRYNVRIHKWSTSYKKWNKFQ
jgi:hypothetical protein